jgi:hypothetical protein
MNLIFPFRKSTIASDKSLSKIKQAIQSHMEETDTQKVFAASSKSKGKWFAGKTVENGFILIDIPEEGNARPTMGRSEVKFETGKIIIRTGMHPRSLLRISIILLLLFLFLFNAFFWNKEGISDTSIVIMSVIPAVVFASFFRFAAQAHEEIESKLKKAVRDQE